MKSFKEYFSNVKPKNLAYDGVWISPKGKVLNIEKNEHILDVVANPKKYGLDDEYIEEMFKKHGSKLNDNFRNEVLIDVLKNGWMRLRFNRQFWSVELWGWNKRKEKYLFNFLYGDENKYKIKDTRIFDLKVNRPVIMEEDMKRISVDEGIQVFTLKGFPAAIISASRNEYSDSENKKRTNKLRSDIASYKELDYVQVWGGYIEDGEIEVKERSFIVIGKDDSDLFSIMKKLNKKYDQEGFIFKDSELKKRGIYDSYGKMYVGPFKTVKKGKNPYGYTETTDGNYFSFYE